MALTPRRDTFDPGNQLNPMWPPPAPGYPRPRPRPRSSQQPDPGYDDDYGPQFIPPYVPPGPGQQSPFQPIPPGQIIPPVEDYVAQMPQRQFVGKKFEPKKTSGYNYPDVYPPSGITPEHGGVGEEAGGQRLLPTPLDRNFRPIARSSSEVNRLMNEQGMREGTGGTLPTYPNNPIDYTAPWNVGPYEEWHGYDPPGVRPWPSDQELQRRRGIELKRKFGEPNPLVQGSPFGGMYPALSDIGNMMMPGVR